MSKLIVLDAGHGYSTPGKRTPDGMREYEFNRVVANYAKAELEKYEGVRVMFTHSDQRDVPLKERTDNANKAKADVFVSIHANAFGSGGWNDANGIETFIHPQTPTATLNIAQAIHRELIAKTKRRDRGVKRANFHVLRETNMSAVLAECGFMTNREEAALLKTDVYRKLCAEAIVEGLVKYYGLKRKATPKPKPAQSSDTLYRVQIGAFSVRDNAEKMLADAKAKGFKDAFIAEVKR